MVDQREHFERLHARKRLHDNFVDDPDVRAMFLDEARIAGFIRHPHVVSVTDVGEDEDGPFIVMDFVDGIAFSAMIRQLASQGVTLPLSVALSLLAQAAEGLHAAHEAIDSTGQSLNVVHRDVSPHNILVGFDGHARVADFGIAKAVGRSSTRTETGVLKGKLGYSSPEVLRFEDADVRSDLFSFGVVVYEAVTMMRLYPSGTGGPRAILNDPAPDLGDVVEDAPDELVELTFSLLAKDPAHRPSSAGEVAARLRSILRDLPFDDVMSVSDFLQAHFAEEQTAQRRRIEDARSSVRRSKPASASRRRWVWVALPILLLAAAGALAWHRFGGAAVDTRSVIGADEAMAPAPQAPESSEVEAVASPVVVSPAPAAEASMSEERDLADRAAPVPMRSGRGRRGRMSTMRQRQSNTPIWDEY